MIESVNHYFQKAKLDDDLIINNDTPPTQKTIEKESITTFQKLPTKLFPDKQGSPENTATEAMKRTKYLQEKSTLMKELNEKYNFQKSPEFTYGLNVIPKQVTFAFKITN